MYPIQGLDGGYPILLTGGGGVPHLKSGQAGYPILLMGGHTPPQVWMGVPHSRSGWGIPHPADGLYLIQDQDRGYPGVPPVEEWKGYPLSKKDGVPPPIQDWMGYPSIARLDGVTPPLPIRQSSIASTCYAAGRYVSCVHAGGLSCYV